MENVNMIREVMLDNKSAEQLMQDDNLKAIYDTPQPSDEQLEHLQQLNKAVEEQVIKGSNPIPFMGLKPKGKVAIKEYKIGRNDPCPCGSGKKYKTCCLNSGKYEKYIEKKN